MAKIHSSQITTSLIMMSRLVLVFLFVVQTHSLSVLTDDKSQATKTDGETALVRQLLNQETLIRMALDKKVNDLVKIIAEIQNSLGTNNQQLQDAKKEIAALKNENSALKAEWQVQSNVTTLLSVKDTPVAFTASLTSPSDSWLGDILVFPHVITNKGQGYSSSSGKFTAPRDGTYVFALTAVSYYSNHLRLDIVHDGDSKVRTWSDSSARYQTGTNLVVLELDRGDAVWVTRYYGQGYYTHSVPLTTFSGFLL
uniref:Complement C1q-like protein 2 isoform X2 n=1 Tax=Crassostrea virginica TaxID=6565 RepID=A0A8B8CW96_CRAVI|nr:complement C1q-like protein 2 isoform X2 [Crassostrea virginica]